MRQGLRLAAVFVLLVSLAPRRSVAQDPSAEQFARRQYESGLAFMREGKYAEALKDFRAVVDSYPASAVAGDALLEIARYQFEVAGEWADAQATTDALLKKYPSGAAAPMGHVLAGRIVLARRQTQGDIDTALASFERVLRLFPGSDAVPAALYYSGEAQRIARRPDAALEQDRQVVMRYPSSLWAARAELGSAICLTASGRAPRAMEALQRVRARFPGTPEAAQALAWNTILYRLYLRPPAQPAFVFSSRVIPPTPGKLKDVEAIVADRRDILLVATKNGVTAFDGKGAPVRSFGGPEPRSLFLDRTGRPVVAQKTTIQSEGGAAILLSVPKPGSTPRELDGIPAGVALTTGDYVLVDRQARGLARFGRDGKYVAAFAPLNASRLAINPLDDIAAIDREAKAIGVLDRDGKPLFKILSKGPGYELDEPSDLAWDPLGHLYVLDRGARSVFVFGPQGKLVVAFTTSEKAAGALRRPTAFTLDSAGRLLIYDDREERVQIYQ